MAERALSIIIPVYNAAAFIPRCLDSLLAQSYGKLQLICVNDGSTDGSASVLDVYAANDSRIKGIHQENAGVCAARNRGLDAATGEFVTFVDADDWVEPQGYERVMQCFAPEIDVVCFGTSVDGELSAAERADWEWFLTVPAGGVLPVRNLAKTHVNACIWNKVWRRDVVEKHRARFAEDIQYTEDECFFYCTLGGVRKLCCLPDKIYHYVQQPHSAMHDMIKLGRRAQDAVRGARFLLEFYKKTGVYGEMKEVFLSRFHQCFVCAEKYAPPDLKDWVQQEEYGIVCAGGLKQHREKFFVRSILNRQMGKLARVFCRYIENRLVIGIGQLRLASVTYDEEKTTWRVLGRVVRVRYLITHG